MIIFRHNNYLLSKPRLLQLWMIRAKNKIAGNLQNFANCLPENVFNLLGCLLWGYSLL